MSVQPQVADVLDALEKAGVGSVFEKTPIGWNVKWVDGGTVIHVQGATITDALGSHGAQVVHPSNEPVADVVVEESLLEETTVTITAADVGSLDTLFDEDAE